MMCGLRQGIGGRVRRLMALAGLGLVGLLALSMPALAQYGGRVPGGTWPQVCRSGYMDGPFLFRATCLNKDGEWRDASMDMRNCPSWVLYSQGAYLHCGQGQSTGGASYQGWGGGLGGGGYRGGDHGGGYGGYGGYSLPAGPWRNECRNGWIQYGYLLRASCLNRKREWRDASLDLRTCPRGSYVYSEGAYLRCG